MGMFYSVLVPCPKCGEKSEFQSKGGECLLQVYELEDCPFDVLSDINRHAPNTCLKCGAVFEVGEGCGTVFEVKVKEKLSKT